MPITYRNHSNLLLSEFIDCYVDGKLKLLVESGNPNEIELQEYWQEFLMLYYEMIGSTESKQFFTLQKQIEVKQYQLAILEKSLDIYLAFRNNKNAKEQIDKLKSTISRLGFHFESSLKDNQIVKLYEVYIKSEYIEFQKLNEQLKNQMQSGNAENKKPQRSMFLENIVSMAKNGFHVELKDTVEYYCTTVKMFNTYCKEQENAYKKINNKANGR